VTWTWKTSCPPPDPDLSKDLSIGWSNRGEAEQWLHDTFTELLDDGVAAVTLMDDETPVYSMDLNPQN